MDAAIDYIRLGQLDLTGFHVGDDLLYCPQCSW